MGATALAEALAANPDPKFQQSKFLEFLSKMNRGEIEFQGNQVDPCYPNESKLTPTGVEFTPTEVEFPPHE